MKTVNFWPVLALCAASACGNAAEVGVEARPVAGFDQVVLRAVGELAIEQGDKESLSVEAEKRLLPKISTEVKAGVLYLDIKARQFSSEHPVRYTLTVKRLTRVTTEGSGNVTAGKLKVEALKLDPAGSGNISVAGLNGKELVVLLRGSGDVAVEGGSVGAQRVEIGGAGNYAAPKLVSGRTEVAIDGSGNAEVAARDALSVRIAGAGEVAYYGNPKLTQSISGAGSVTRSGGI